MEAAVIHEYGPAKMQTVQLPDESSKAYNDKIDALRHTEYPMLQGLNTCHHSII